MKRFLQHTMAAMLLYVTVFTASAAIPAGYYSSLTGKSEAALKTALYQIISPHTQVSSYSNLPQYFEKTDVYPNSSRWWDMYSDIPLYLPWSGQKLNREHSLPKSWWGGDENTPAYVDLFHLYPSEKDANLAKNNYPLGIVTDGGSKFNNGVSKVGLGQNDGGAAYVFEPDDEYKGDFARTYFYMVTCYQNFSWKYTYMCMNGTYPSLQQWAIDMLLEWHRRDPVSQKEQNRNEQVFLIQNNRNPFIDDPELAEYIWGNKKGQAYTASTTPIIPGGEPTLTTPPNGMTLDFSQTAIDHSTTSTLHFKGEYLTGYFELSIVGTDKEYFTLSTSTVQAEAANSASGTWITVTYHPTETGSHEARLIIQDGGLAEGSRAVTLLGECLPLPNLSKITATEPTDITAASYTANWDEPDDDNIDHYIVTLRRYKNGDVTVSELPAENNYLEITGFDEADYDTYSVQSVSLGIRSEASNVITVSNAAISQINTDKPLMVESFPGMLRFRCSEPHSDVKIYDLTGRMVSRFEEVTDGMEITLPAGAYLITSDRHRSPLKAIAR